MLSAGSAKALSYLPEDVSDVLESGAEPPRPSRQAQAWIGTDRALANGELTSFTDHVQTVSGHPGGSLPDCRAQHPKDHEQRQHLTHCPPLDRPALRQGTPP